MTTYFAKITFKGSVETHTNQTAKQVASLKAMAEEIGATFFTAKMTKGGAVCHDGTTEVAFIEDRQLGWTLVFNQKTGKQYYAHTYNINFY